MAVVCRTQPDTVWHMRAMVAVVAVVFIAAAPIPEWQTTVSREHPRVGTIFDVAAGAAITPETLITRLVPKRFVILGEKHDNPDHHRLQAWVLAELVAAGRKPAVVFEMFRLDQADAIARHLAAAPDDARGLGDVLEWRRSGWPAWAMYEPIVAAALRARLPLVAGNLSETTTAAVRRGGLAALDTATLARLRFDQPLADDVRGRLVTELRDAHCGHLPESGLDNFVAVQRARDAQMAAAMREAGGDGALLIAGAGHGRKDMGVPLRLPASATASVGFIEVRDGAPATLPFDYVWTTPRVDDRDPCESFRRR